MKKLLRIICPILIVIGIIIAYALPVYAAPNNPTAITFGAPTSQSPKYRAFYNVSETGDMLFMAESYVDYTAPNTAPASSATAFLFELVSADGSTIYASTPLWAYEDKPVSIYLTHAQVLSIGLSNNSEYILRITGNPLLFTSLVKGTNVVSVSLGTSDWFDQSLNSAGTLSPLRAFGLAMMQNIETNDAPPAAQDYLVSVSGIVSITDAGANIMLGGVTGLDTWCPNLFQFSVAPLSVTTPSSAGTYANSLSTLGQLGTLTDTGLKGLGQWLGLGTNGVMAGGILYLALTLGAVVWMATKIQSPLVLPIGSLGLITIGAFLGFIPLSILFMVIAFIVVLTAIYFFTRVFWT
jgi:hypothetical protein